MIDLAHLVSPCGAEDFLGSVWGRRAEVFRGQPDRFGSLLPWSALNEILRRHRLQPPRLRLVHGGERVPVEDYTVATTPRRGESYPRLRYDALAAHVRQGSTLVIDAVDELYGPVDDLAVELERTLRERVQVNCYASFGEVHGFDTHWDDHDVLVLQVSGRKRWRVFGPTRTHPTRRDVAEPEPPTGEPELELVLNQGDVLHVPRGWWHDATALAGPSLHLTFGMTAPTGADLYTWLADELRRFDLARQDLPRFADAATRGRYVAELARSATALLAEPDLLDRFFAARDAQAPARGYASLPWLAADEPDDRHGVVRIVAPRAVLSAHDDVVELAADGRRCTFARPAEPALRMLLDSRPHAMHDLCDAAALDAPTIRTLCADLVRLGLAAVS